MIVELKFSDSGRVLEILSDPLTGSENQKTIARILVHGFLRRAIEASNNYIFHGEFFQLANYEYLDLDHERIVERENE